MRRDAELVRALLDVRALFVRNAAGVGKNGVHREAAFLEIRNAETRVEAARESEHDLFVGHHAAPSEADVRFCLTSSAMIAFCTCRRFSASSIAMHAGESI